MQTDRQCSASRCCYPLTARRPPAAVSALKDWLQQAVSCVSDAVINLSPDAYHPSDTPHRLTLGDGTPVPVTARSTIGHERLWLSVVHAYRIVRETERGWWKIHTAAYQYALDDPDGREILAYHWHPHIEDIPYPHLHVGHGAVRRDIGAGIQLPVSQNALHRKLAGAHLPTRRIALEDVLRLLIEQFDVWPARTDWNLTLRRARKSFTSERTWL